MWSCWSTSLIMGLDLKVEKCAEFYGATRCSQFLAPVAVFKSLVLRCLAVKPVAPVSFVSCPWSTPADEARRHSCCTRPSGFRWLGCPHRPQLLLGQWSFHAGKNAPQVVGPPPAAHSGSVAPARNFPRSCGLGSVLGGVFCGCRCRGSNAVKHPSKVNCTGK